MSVVRPYALGGNTTVAELTVRTGADIDGTTLVVNDATDKVGIGLADPKTKLTVEGTITLKEQAAADADTAAYGQIWTKTATPCELYFRTDSGDDIQLTTGTSPAGGGAVSAVANGADNRIVTFSSSTALNGEATLTFDGTSLTVPSWIKHNGDLDTSIKFTDDQINITVGNEDFIKLKEDGNSAITFNKDGNDIDIIMASDDETHMFFIDSGLNAISIGDSTDAPAGTLEITNHASAGATGMPLLQLNSNDVDQQAIDINAANTTSDVIDINANSLTTHAVVKIDADALTTGSIMKLVSNSATTNPRTLVEIVNDNTAATDTTLMKLQNDAITPAASLIIESTANDANPLVELVNTYNAADRPPILRFNKLGHASDDMQIGRVSFYGEDDAGTPNPKEYCSIVAMASDVTSAGNAQSGEMRFNALVNNVETECIRLGREDTAGGTGAFALQINAGSSDLDFIISGDNVGNLVRIKASNDIVGIGGVPSETTAVLSVISTTQGFLPPRMTTTQQNAISSPASGLMLYNTSTNKLMVYNGSAWTALH